jgi:hypothetical protein
VVRAQNPACEKVSISLLLQLYRSPKQTKDRLTTLPASLSQNMARKPKIDMPELFSENVENRSVRGGITFFPR